MSGTAKIISIKIRQLYHGKEPSFVRVYDPKTGVQRDAQFYTEHDAAEACAIMSRLITTSTFEGTELIITELVECSDGA